MNTTSDILSTQDQNTLIALRQKLSLLVSQSESEDLLADAVAILSRKPLPCAYTYEQMENALKESESDYESRNFISHSSICERYGL